VCPADRPRARILTSFAIIRVVELRQFFGRAIGASLRDLALGDDPASAYLADLLTRFARTENLYPRALATPRLETVVDMLLETQAVWEDAASFQPEREVVVRRHIGDFTLFMTGIFPERVEQTASTRYYIDQGKRAYHFVSGAPLYRRLADRFERYVDVLAYARKVHFRDHPQHPFFGWSFG